MAQSALPYPSNPSLEQLRVISTDSVIYLSPSGNDGTGDGSLAAPYKTLAKAMTVARTYTIVGSATLYVRLLRGEYTITENVDLYHPQGGNLIIEGDPDAFQQRTLWQVENYTWNLASFAGGGHTGSIRLFDGVTTNISNGGVTMHGFTGQDQGMYFTITNAAIGSRDGYVTNTVGGNYGINSTNNPTSPQASTTLFAGDRFFNHGVSFEDAEGVLGIGRILGATTSTAVLNVQFQNLNIDTRCPGLTWGGGNAGINNTISWGGIVNNYPEPQYSQPNGYYGDPAGVWKNDAATVNYPSNPGVSHNTVDPYILSTYPVVIRAAYMSNIGSLFLKNGTLKALRNIFFANNGEPYVGSTGTTGATLNTSQAIVSALGVSNTGWGEWGTGLYLENANIGIRHLGFYGMGVAISAYGSTVRSYYDASGDTGSSSASAYGTTRFAKQNTLDNSPVICTSQVFRGLVAKNSVVDFTDGSAQTREWGTDYRMHTSYISTTGRGIDLTTTRMSASSLTISSVSDAPKLSGNFILPVFPGMTVSGGASAHIAAYGLQQVWQKYPVAKMFMQPFGESEVEIGYLNYYANAGAVVGGYATAVAGSTTSPATLWTGTDHASSYNRILFWGVKTAPHGLSYMNAADIKYGITAGLGGTFTVRFYNDMNLSGVSAWFSIGKSSVLLAGANGQTVGYKTIQTASTQGASAAAYLESLFSFDVYGMGGNDTQGNISNGAVRIQDGSNVNIEKALVISNGGYAAVDVRRNSSLLVGDSKLSDTGNGRADILYDQFRNLDAAPVLGNLSIRGFSGKAVHVADNSSITVGSLFIKHPLHSDAPDAASPTPLVIIKKMSTGNFGRIYAVTHPAGKLVSDSTITPLWTTIRGQKWGSHYQASAPESMLRANAGSSIYLSGAGSMFAFDGGTADLKVGAGGYNQYAVFGSYTGSLIVSEGSLAVDAPGAAAPGGTRIILDSRTTPQKIMTRSPSTTSNRYLYGAPTTRTWLGDQSGTEHNYIATPTNIGAIGTAPAVGATPSTSGNTYSAVLGKGGSITN